LETLRSTILELVDYVPDVTENTDSDFESLFHYTEADVGFGSDEFDDRKGIERVAIVFVAQNPTDDQDFYAAIEFAHETRTSDDTKLITIAMGTGIDVEKVGLLSFGRGFSFGADYDQLPTLVTDINRAICQSEPSGCGV